MAKKALLIFTLVFCFSCSDDDCTKMVELPGLFFDGQQIGPDQMVEVPCDEDPLAPIVSLAESN